MTFFNPLAGAVAATPALQRAQQAEKERQVRHAQLLLKNAGAEGDRFERQVESDDAINPAHPDDESKQEQPKGRKKKQEPSEASEAADDEPPHLDLKA